MHMEAEHWVPQHGPTHTGQHERSYFSDAFSRVTIKNGRAHGHGYFISIHGDEYSGNFVNGKPEGLGEMVYGSGDKYIGSWQDGETHGKGVYTYKKTNNVYEGGFKAGRHHGKGVMRFEVADEEEALCQICYEGEIDAVFYTCGHMVACLTCARMMQNQPCPVCRKDVRDVIRVYKA